MKNSKNLLNKNLLPKKVSWQAVSSDSPYFCRNTFFFIQVDETTALERFQQTVCELDNDLNLARKEYENVCVDYEVNTISKEQAIPIQEQVNSLKIGRAHV